MPCHTHGFQIHVRSCTIMSCRKNKGAIPGIKHGICQLRVGCFVQLNYLALFFRLTLFVHFAFCPPTLLSYYRLVASRLIYYDFPVSSECSLPLSYDDRQAAEENRTLDLSRNRRGSRWLYAVPLHQIWNMEFGF